MCVCARARVDVVLVLVVCLFEETEREGGRLKQRQTQRDRECVFGARFQTLTFTSSVPSSADYLCGYQVQSLNPASQRLMEPNNITLTVPPLLGFDLSSHPISCC